MDALESIPEHSDELSYHGGNINAARLRFPNAPLPWIDLSTGINPVPYPIGAVSPDSWARLPEPSSLAALEAAARQTYGAGPAADIVAASGTQALLQWLPNVVRARRVGVLGFTYGEHEKCWRRAGAEVVTVESADQLSTFDVGVVVNPNNPDGRLVARDVLIAQAGNLARRNGLLIVDEAFMDMGCAGDSLVSEMPPAGAVVLRSFGKLYGLAGLRLGFAVTTPDLGAALREAMGPWPVSGPAIEIGRRALADAAWRRQTRSRLRHAAERMDLLLRAAGFAIAGGTKLFRLAEHNDAATWFAHLARHGILTRPFLTKPRWLRFGLPGAAGEWQRLEAALRSVR
jgi:cobalamin biosynthetic protein CobC